MNGGIQKGLSITIYLPTDDPDGFRIVSKSHWTGKGLVIPRALYPECKHHPDLEAAGVYVLVGPAIEKGDRFNLCEGLVEPPQKMTE